jgi:hypothetical protein
MLVAIATADADELVGGRLILELLRPSQHSNSGAKKAVQVQTIKTEKNSGDEECIVLNWDRKSFNKPYLPINKSGKYCLDQNYEFTCDASSHGCGGELIDIMANDVDIDMRGYSLMVSGTRFDGTILP